MTFSCIGIYIHTHFYFKMDMSKPQLISFNLNDTISNTSKNNKDRILVKLQNMICKWKKHSAEGMFFSVWHVTWFSIRDEGKDHSWTDLLIHDRLWNVQFIYRIFIWIGESIHLQCFAMLWFACSLAQSCLAISTTIACQTAMYRLNGEILQLQEFLVWNYNSSENSTT